MNGRINIFTHLIKKTINTYDFCKQQFLIPTLNYKKTGGHQPIPIQGIQLKSLQKTTNKNYHSINHRKKILNQPKKSK
jgi:hypothetical protein